LITLIAPTLLIWRLIVSQDQTKKLLKEREQAEEALVEAKEEAELANRAKTEFLAAVSHELRTPLNAIIGFSELIQRKTFGPLANDKYAEYVTYIHTSGNHLLDLVNDILDIAAVESGHLELSEGVLDVGAITEAAFRMVESHAKTRSIDLTRDLGPRLPGLLADERKVKQIVLNLLSNAVKFTPKGGRVSFEARLEDDAMVLVVADSGLGMDEDGLTKALTKFGQVSSELSHKNQGTGLGLPLVRGLMEAHGGTLELQSEIGVGTTATVRFPNERIVS
jgi:signal transduction histidine kinase